MAEDSPVSAVYARALFEAAGEDATSVDAELCAVREAITADPELWGALTAPEITAKQQLGALDAAVSGASTITRNLLRVLVDNRRLELLPETIAAFNQLVAEAEQQMDVIITTAIELSPELRTQLEERLSGATGRTVRLHTAVDPSIIGGLIAQYGDTQIDSSLRGRLDALKLELAHTSVPNPGA